MCSQVPLWQRVLPGLSLCWEYRKISDCFAAPISQYLDLLNWYFSSGGGRSCTYQAGLSNIESWEIALCNTALLGGTYDVLHLRVPFFWEHWIEYPKGCLSSQLCWWRASSHCSAEPSCWFQLGCCIFLLRVGNTNEMPPHLHCLCPHFVLGKEKKLKSCWWRSKLNTSTF